MRRLLGIQRAPPEYVVVPPRRSVRSSTSTSAPPTAAVHAALMPEPPEPITITSTCTGALPSVLVPPERRPRRRHHGLDLGHLAGERAQRRELHHGRAGVDVGGGRGHGALEVAVDGPQ